MTKKPKKRNTFHELYFGFINIFFPRICEACGTALFKNENVICTSCKYHLPTTNFHLNRNNFVERLFWGKVEIEAGTSFLMYQKGERVQKLIHKLKYKNKPQIGEKLGELMGEQLAISPAFNDADFIIPLPLHPKKKKIRGYNQAEHICIGLSKKMNIELVSNQLIRKKHTSTQTKKAKYERYLNVKNIFAVKSPENLENKKIIIVDDVVTTGSTMEAAIATLSNISDIKICIATLAYADA